LHSEQVCLFLRGYHDLRLDLSVVKNLSGINYKSLVLSERENLETKIRQVGTFADKGIGIGPSTTHSVLVSDFKCRSIH
jgi:hypothetical protein